VGFPIGGRKGSLLAYIALKNRTKRTEILLVYE
jgi:hypothetical protein